MFAVAFYWVSVLEFNQTEFQQYQLPVGVFVGFLDSQSVGFAK